MAEDRRLSHHDLCFGCGQANLFGLQLDLTSDGDDRASGRFFVKQDHQGPPGYAHGGVLAAALDEAMSLLVHERGALALTGRFELDLLAPAPIGGFVLVEAEVEEVDGRRVHARARARDEAGKALAEARGTFVEVSA